MPLESSSPADGFATFVAILEDVARQAGASDEAMTTLGLVLGKARADAAALEEVRALREQALGWKGVLCGESQDYSATGGGLLHEWAAALLAHVLGNTQRADVLQRELRRRGVAAFGLVEQAA